MLRETNLICPSTEAVIVSGHERGAATPFPPTLNAPPLVIFGIPHALVEGHIVVVLNGQYAFWLLRPYIAAVVLHTTIANAEERAAWVRERDE
jgi:hypothetical protein